MPQTLIGSPWFIVPPQSLHLVRCLFSSKVWTPIPNVCAGVILRASIGFTSHWSFGRECKEFGAGCRHPSAYRDGAVYTLSAKCRICSLGVMNQAEPYIVK
jgi:hypothetical protein